MRILFIGDVVGRPGRVALKHLLGDLTRKWACDFVIVNGENSAAGYGVTDSTLDEILDAGANCITTGNHVWAQKETQLLVEREPRLLRPANYPAGAPGRGWGVYVTGTGIRVGVMNLLGRVFMVPLDCPFQVGDAGIAELREQCDIIIIDFHAEATSEKRAYAEYVNGRVTAVIGTHTHVQTSDERILDRGTAFITDCGMTGPSDSIIGVDKDTVMRRFLTGMPMRFEVPKQSLSTVEGVVIECDDKHGCATGITRFRTSYPPGEEA